MACAPDRGGIADTGPAELNQEPDRDSIAAVVRAAFLERDRWILVPQRDGVSVLERYCDAPAEPQRHRFDDDKAARAFIWDRVLDQARAAANGPS